ncbi:MAG TPA: hypothetical protein DCZ05_07575 [Deltaproteobacteria bacterium]|nr:hypothetical protein [Deltaproteobacteria bacterium]
MGTWPKIVESFPLTVGQVSRQYTRIPADASHLFYHYATHAGLKGILRSGGLRAMYRMKMNDTGEFDYARNIIYEALNEVGRRRDLPNVAQDLMTYTRKNLDKFLADTTEMSSAYCTCLTVSPDHPEQWGTYAELGRGFAIGFNMLLFPHMQVPAVQKGEPFVFCAPVTYNQRDQRDLVWRLVEAGICDLQTFAATRSRQSEYLTALRDRVTREIVAHLLTLIDFIKAPTYSSEREMRLILAPNDGTLNAPHIQHYERDNESMPFIFMDFRNPKTGRLPLAEIKVGPKASFPEEKAFLEDLLDELGYGSNYGDRPRITQSAVAMVGCL